MSSQSVNKVRPSATLCMTGIDEENHRIDTSIPLIEDDGCEEGRHFKDTPTYFMYKLIYQEFKSNVPF